MRIPRLLSEQQVLAYEYHGTCYDCGSKLGFLRANVEYALKHPELAEDFNAYLKWHFCHADKGSFGSAAAEVAAAA